MQGTEAIGLVLLVSFDELKILWAPLFVWKILIQIMRRVKSIVRVEFFMTFRVMIQMCRTQAQCFL